MVVGSASATSGATRSSCGDMRNYRMNLQAPSPESARKMPRAVERVIAKDMDTQHARIGERTASDGPKGRWLHCGTSPLAHRTRFPDGTEPV